MEFSDVIQPAHLACSSSNNADVVAIGNGLLREKAKDLAPSLQFVHLETISKSECATYFPINALHKSIICAEGLGKRSICKGDLGGALIDEDSAKLIGISSFVSSWYGCERGAPQAFTNVPEYLSWIEMVTNVTCKN